jgi:hypothetical protein
MKLVLLMILSLFFSGCYMYSGWQLQLAEADRTRQQAAILTAYRDCLAEFKGHAAEAKANCEHYTQALTILDVRGLR